MLETTSARLRNLSLPDYKIALVLSLLIALSLSSPLIFLGIELKGLGFSSLLTNCLRPLTLSLLVNTLELSVLVSASTLILGFFCAWLIEQTNIKFKNILGTLLVVPFAVPDFIISFSWYSLSPSVHGIFGALLVMTFALYPLMYFPIASALRSYNKDLEEVARSLGASKIAVFFKILVPQLKKAIFGGTMLVLLTVFSEYGAFEILGYQTFTTEIFTEFNNFDLKAAASLALVLVVLSLVALFINFGVESSSKPVSNLTGYRKNVDLGKWHPLAMVFILSVIAVSVGIPISTCIYWIFNQKATYVIGASLLSSLVHSFIYCFLSAFVATILALPVALYTERKKTAFSHIIFRTTYIMYGLPGIITALALTYFSLYYLKGFLFQSSEMVVIAYVILFYPLALVCVKSAVARTSKRFEEQALTLGKTKTQAFFRVTLPIIAPGLASSFALMFSACITELTATLLLKPIGVETLATNFWYYEQNLAFGQASEIALVIIALGLIPSFFFNRYFQGLSAKTT